MVFAESGFELLDDATDEEYQEFWATIVPLSFNKKMQPELPKKTAIL
jgi:magnesium chelatase subunit I